jgi:DNA-binding response OmpR family regulator
MKARVLLWCNRPPLDGHLVAALRSEICELTLATDRRRAQGIACSGHFDVLVLDFESNSREFPQLAARSCRTLVLAESLEQLILALETRVDAALMKPFDPQQVRTVIRWLLGGARMNMLPKARADRKHSMARWAGVPSQRQFSNCRCAASRGQEFGQHKIA